MDMGCVVPLHTNCTRKNTRVYNPPPWFYFSWSLSCREVEHDDQVVFCDMCVKPIVSFAAMGFFCIGWTYMLSSHCLTSLQYVAVCRRVSPCVAVCCSVLQCVAIFCLCTVLQGCSMLRVVHLQLDKYYNYWLRLSSDLHDSSPSINGGAGLRFDGMMALYLVIVSIFVSIFVSVCFNRFRPLLFLLRYTCTHTHTYIYVYTCMYVYIYIHVYIYIYYTYLYIYAYICTYVCIYTTHTHTHSKARARTHTHAHTPTHHAHAQTHWFSVLRVGLFPCLCLVSFCPPYEGVYYKQVCLYVHMSNTHKLLVHTTRFTQIGCMQKSWRRFVMFLLKVAPRCVRLVSHMFVLLHGHSKRGAISLLYGQPYYCFSQV